MTEQRNVGGSYADEEGMHETVNVRQVGIDNYWMNQDMTALMNVMQSSAPSIMFFACLGC